MKFYCQNTITSYCWFEFYGQVYEKIKTWLRYYFMSWIKLGSTQV